VAIKKIASSSDHSWARIYKQQLLASKLQHKNIVKVLGYGHKDGDGRVKGYYWLKNTCRMEAWTRLSVACFHLILIIVHLHRVTFVLK